MSDRQLVLLVDFQEEKFRVPLSLVIQRRAIEIRRDIYFVVSLVITLLMMIVLGQ
jgi:hypothetical protein